jgi:hypothetical protein
MSEIYKLEQWEWTQKDFEKMGWHDCSIHAFAFFIKTSEFGLDIDYIFQWIEPKKGKKYFHFWVAPVTFVFENVRDLKLDIETDSKIMIDSITRNNPQKSKNSERNEKQEEWCWNIKCQEGTISLRSVGYKMFVKKQPVLKNEQILNIDERGGISFIRYRIDT